jgi:hypothetical protein
MTITLEQLHENVYGFSRKAASFVCCPLIWIGVRFCRWQMLKHPAAMRAAILEARRQFPEDYPLSVSDAEVSAKLMGASGGSPSEAAQGSEVVE